GGGGSGGAPRPTMPGPGSGAPGSGGGAPGSGGGGFPRMPGGFPGAPGTTGGEGGDEAENIPYPVIVVVEVEATGNYLRRFSMGVEPGVPFRHPWGTLKLFPKSNL